MSATLSPVADVAAQSAPGGRTTRHKGQVVSVAPGAPQLLERAGRCRNARLLTATRLPPFRCRENAGPGQTRFSGPLVRFRYPGVGSGLPVRSQHERGRPMTPQIFVGHFTQWGPRKSLPSMGRNPSRRRLRAAASGRIRRPDRGRGTIPRVRANGTAGIKLAFRCLKATTRGGNSGMTYG